MIDTPCLFQGLLIIYVPFCRSKHGGDSSVRAIRKNLKEMKTTDMTWANEEDADDHMQAVVEQNESDDVHMASVNDKKRGPDEVYEHSAATDTNDIEPDANVNTDAPIPPASPRKKPTRRDTAEIELLHEQKESSESEKEDKSSPKKTSLFAQFAGKSSSSATNGDDWDDFAEEETPSSKPSSQQEKEKPKPKYAFGSSSGFGTKGWGAAHQTAPIPGGSPFRSTGKVRRNHLVKVQANFHKINYALTLFKFCLFVRSDYLWWLWKFCFRSI